MAEARAITENLSVSYNSGSQLPGLAEVFTFVSSARPQKYSMKIAVPPNSLHFNVCQSILKN